MSVLVGIPTHKRPELLRQCLESIERQQGKLPTVRVFVADNDSGGQDGSRVARELATTFRFPIGSTVVAEPGISAVRNAILDEARRGRDEFIAMIDDDETASPQWLAELLAMQAQHGADIIGGPVEFQFGPEVSEAFKGAFWVDRRPGGKTERIYATNGVLISRSVLEKTGWPEFDPEFGLTGGEDDEWFTRIRKLGATFAWASDALAFEHVHLERTRVGWLFKRQFRVGANQVRICRRHGSRAELRQLLWDAAKWVAATPLLAFRLIRQDKRFPTIRMWARAVGRLAAVMGLHYREYAARHG